MGGLQSPRWYREAGLRTGARGEHANVWSVRRSERSIKIVGEKRTIAVRNINWRNENGPFWRAEIPA
jgi:hypothetical protein